MKPVDIQVGLKPERATLRIYLKNGLVLDMNPTNAVDAEAAVGAMNGALKGRARGELAGTINIGLFFGPDAAPGQLWLQLSEVAAVLIVPAIPLPPARRWRPWAAKAKAAQC